MTSAPYDGFLSIRSVSNATATYVKVNDIYFTTVYTGSSVTIPFKKGDKIEGSGSFVQAECWIAFFNKRDYSNR